jgi:hypothetical protein
VAVVGLIDNNNLYGRIDTSLGHGVLEGIRNAPTEMEL